MKTYQLLAYLTVSMSGSLLAQNIISSSSFYDPDFKVRRDGATSGVLNLTATNTPVSGSNAVGNPKWTLSAGGHAQVRTNIPLVANLDAQLAAYTATVNDTLVFGREITTQAQLLGGLVDVSSDLQGLTNQLAGASLTYNWEASSVVSGLAIVPDQLYQVSFDVTSGAGLPVNLLSSSSFGITTPGITGASNQSASVLNLLGLVSLGSGSSTGNYNFIFKSNQNLSALTFDFAATSIANVSALGGTAGNQNVLTYSNFQVNAIPEPGSLAIVGASIGIFALRRKRRN